MRPLLLVAALLFTVSIQAQEPAAIKNIVLVHGAFVGGAGWKPVYDILVRYGYQVSIVQQPLDNFKHDVEAVQRVIALQNGPCILVGHSYGGAIITEAGNDPAVAGLVYIAAHAPDEGESEAENGRLYPPLYKSLMTTADGYDFIDPLKYYNDFAPDLSFPLATFESRAQILTADTVFHAVIQHAAWKTKPSWYMVAKADRIISPDLERMYARRAHSVTLEMDGASHSVYQSQPGEVAELIMEAANHAGDKR